MKIKTEHKKDSIDIQIDFEDSGSIEKVMNTLVAINETIIKGMSEVAAKTSEAKLLKYDEIKIRKDLYLDLAEAIKSLAEEEVDG